MVEGRKVSGWRKERGSLVISHVLLTWIRAELRSWRATRTKMANLYAFSLSCAKNVPASGKMLFAEAPPTVMVKKVKYSPSRRRGKEALAPATGGGRTWTVRPLSFALSSPRSVTTPNPN
jgi:hypothetical protein